MKRFVYGAVALCLAVAFTSSLWAEEGHGGDGRREKRREGGDGAAAGAEARDLTGTFSKGDGGAVLFKSGETTYTVVAGEKITDDAKEKLKNFETVLVGKGTWVVHGLSKKDSGGKDWLAAETITKREGGDGDRRKEGGDGHRKEGGDRH
ncbi:MAG: hypothetical protein HY291_21560 [Planctomycetes bacterium]|nr:hypothetical protein [Planctomycetota bacterium]